jgi:hypothetical protein
MSWVLAQMQIEQILKINTPGLKLAAYQFQFFIADHQIVSRI